MAVGVRAAPACRCRRNSTMRELITDALDALGLLASAAGAGLLAAGLLGLGTVPAGAGVLTAGVVTVVGSIAMARMG